MTPMLLPDLKKIVLLAAGSNHILALDNKGIVLAWGDGQQNQLGRRIIERNKLSSLQPLSLGLPKRLRIVKIACGSYHSFALDKDGQVWGWGLNNFCETGVDDNVGEDDAVVLKPTVPDGLKNYRVVDIAGGEHHSVACTYDGELLTWGRFDGARLGVAADRLNENNCRYDEKNEPRILVNPFPLPGKSPISATCPANNAGVGDVVRVSAGIDNSFAVTDDGKVFSWGFSANYQTGLGTTEDIVDPTVIENSAIKEREVLWAGAGGQFSIVVAKADV